MQTPEALFMIILSVRGDLLSVVDRLITSYAFLGDADGTAKLGLLLF